MNPPLKPKSPFPTLDYLLYLAEISLAYNSAVLISVTLNLEWAKPRAAGGQFETFPLGIRLIYFGMFFGMIFLMIFLWRHRRKTLDPTSQRLTRIIGYIFLVSTFIQLISKSPKEQSNAIPAAIIAVTFSLLARRDRAALER